MPTFNVRFGNVTRQIEAESVDVEGEFIVFRRIVKGPTANPTRPRFVRIVSHMLRADRVSQVTLVTEGAQ